MTPPLPRIKLGNLNILSKCHRCGRECYALGEAPITPTGTINVANASVWYTPVCDRCPPAARMEKRT